jgi:hypothetical protein
MSKDTLPIFPQEIIDMMKLKKPSKPHKVMTLLQNHGQFSIKFPAVIMRELDWITGDKIDIIIEDDGLKLKKCK